MHTNQTFLVYQIPIGNNNHTLKILFKIIII